jgi:hypothetical protein
LVIGRRYLRVFSGAWIPVCRRKGDNIKTRALFRFNLSGEASDAGFHPTQARRENLQQSAAFSASRSSSFDLIATKILQRTINPVLHRIDPGVL